MDKKLTFKELLPKKTQIGKFSLTPITESSIIKTFDSSLLGKCKVTQDEESTILYDEQGYVHSDVPNDITKTSSVFGVIPISALITKPKKVLLIGLGLGNVYRFIKEFIDSDITCIEYDEDTANICSELMNIPKEDIIVGDGVTSIKDIKDTFDLIILDAYDDFSIPIGFSTKEFWEDIKKISTDDVTITVNYCLPEEGLEIFVDIQKNIKEVFDIKEVISYGVKECLNYVYNYFTVIPKEIDLNAFIKGNYNPSELISDDKIDFLEV